MIMALSLHTILALALTLCVVLQEGFGLPLSGQADSPAQSSSPHVRTKRCSCNSWLDTECIYFCHLDIIWVNSPSKIIPYGLGSPLSRRHRRSAGRCECAHPGDKTCSGFCHNSSENGSIVVVAPLEETVHPDTDSKMLLTSFRNVIRNNMAAVGQPVSSRKKRSRANRLHIR